MNILRIYLTVALFSEKGNKYGIQVDVKVELILAVWGVKLVAESLKAKQLQTSLQAEKQVLASRMQHANATGDAHKQRVSRLEEQV